MSQQTKQVLRISNKVLQIFPSQRRIQQSFNQAQDLEWLFDVPEGMSLIGFVMDANVTTVGAGMTTKPLSQAFQFLRAYAIDGQDSQRTVMQIDQFTLDDWAVVGQFLSEQEGLGVYLSNGTIPYKDPPNVAGGGALYGNWKIYAPLPGKRFRVVASIFNLQQVFGATMTGGNISVSIVPILANQSESGRLRRQFAVSANLYASKTSVFLQAIDTIIGLSPSEWNSIGGNIEMGQKLTPEMITRMEDFWQDQLASFAGTTNGGAANPDFKPIDDGSVNPITGQFVIGAQLPGPSKISIALSTTTSIKLIALTDKVDADKVVISG